MTILLQIDIFHLVLDFLDLKTIIQIRRVCSQWKEWIDAYLSRRETLVICDRPTFWTVALNEQTWGLSVDKIMANRLDILEEELADRSFASSIIKLMPNVRELVLVSEADMNDVEDINYEVLLKGWKGLRKLMIAHLWEEIGRQIIECLNNLPDLETFIILEDIPDEDPFMNGSEDFLKRLKTLSVQTFYWIRNLQKAPNLTALSVNHLTVEDDFSQVFNRTRFPALERVIVDMNFEEVTEKDPNLSNYSMVTNCLERILNSNFESLSFLEFGSSFTYHPQLEKKLLHKFFQIINRFKTVKNLKFKIDNFRFFDSLLENSGEFRYAEKLHILYKPDKPTKLPENFRNFFPKKMKNIKEICIRACMKENAEQLKSIDFSKLPYKVMLEKHLFHINDKDVLFSMNLVRFDLSY